MLPAIITLTTDFGLRDPYVAEMKAAILGIDPKLVIVDVSHQIEKYNVRMGAYVLASACGYFPTGTVHVAVVDPAVGTRRRPVLVEAERGYLIGPDNGLLALAARRMGGFRRAWRITNCKLMLSVVSDTFHGRDIFAPAAAHLARGIPPEQFGPEIHGIEEPEFAKVTLRGSMLVGEVVHVDDFGNIVTNIPEENLKAFKNKDKIHVTIGKRRVRLELLRAYAEAARGEPLALVGGHGFLEISLNQGNAAERLGARGGDKIVLGKRADHARVRADLQKPRGG